LCKLISKSVSLALSALTLLVGGRKGIWPVKTEWWDACVVKGIGSLHA